MGFMPVTSFDGYEDGIECEFCGGYRFDDWVCDCGPHCSDSSGASDCYYENHCAECLKAVANSDRCEFCVACIDCINDLSYHCALCGNCNEAGYEVCTDCNTCMNCQVDAGTHCFECGDCLESGEHCPECDAHGEDWCEDGGEGTHCVECATEFLCEQCNGCTSCRGTEFCDECGLCIECCVENAQSENCSCGEYCIDIGN